VENASQRLEASDEEKVQQILQEVFEMVSLSQRVPDDSLADGVTILAGTMIVP